MDSVVKDFWSVSDDCLIIHHVKERETLYVPDEASCPIPLKYLDVMRRTHTGLESAEESKIEDYWWDAGAKRLSAPWIGKTVFYYLKPPAPSCYEWVEDA